VIEEIQLALDVREPGTSLRVGLAEFANDETQR
jgi:hypothetical protein